MFELRFDCFFIIIFDIFNFILEKMFTKIAYHLYISMGNMEKIL